MKKAMPHFKRLVTTLSKSKVFKNFKKIPGMISLYDFMYEKLKPEGIVMVIAQGNRLYVNSKDKFVARSLIAHGVWERYETELFKENIYRGMTIVDIGANIGYYSLIAAKLLGNTGRVYAFEPEPNNYELLVKNIELNGYENIIPIQKAVSNTNEKIKLFLDRDNLGGSSFSVNNITVKDGFCIVDTVTLDKFFQNNKVDLIKMDVEGAEGLVISGASKLLNKNSNLRIFMEFSPHELENVGTNPLELLHRLRECGFEIKLINERKRCLEPIGAIHELSIYNEEFVNLLLKR